MVDYATAIPQFLTALVIIVSATLVLVYVAGKAEDRR